MNKDKNFNDWDIVIKGHTSLFDLKFKELWQYHDLLQF